jgi:hypothetical protein
MEYNQSNTGGGGSVTQGSSGRDINEHSSLIETTLDGMNSPSYTDRVTGRNPDNTMGGYRHTGFDRGNSNNNEANNYGYGDSVLGGGIKASGSYWQLPTRDRKFLSEEFVPNNVNDVKRLQHILGRTPTGIMDIFTKQKYRAMMSMDLGNKDPMDRDIFGYGGRRNLSVGQIRENKKNAGKKQAAIQQAKRYAQGWRKGPPGDFRSYNTKDKKDNVAWKKAWALYRNPNALDAYNELRNSESSDVEDQEVNNQEIAESQDTAADNPGSVIDSLEENQPSSGPSSNQSLLTQVYEMEDWGFDFGNM